MTQYGTHHGNHVDDVADAPAVAAGTSNVGSFSLTAVPPAPQKRPDGTKRHALSQLRMDASHLGTASLIITFIRYGSLIAACVAVALVGLPSGDTPVSLGPPIHVAAGIVGLCAIAILVALRNRPRVAHLTPIVVQALCVALLAANPEAWGYVFVAAAVWLLCLVGDARQHVAPALVQLIGFGVIQIATRPGMVQLWALCAMALLAVIKIAGVDMLLGRISAQHAHYRSVVEGVSAIVWASDGPGAPISVSDNAVAMLGWGLDEWHEAGFLSRICWPDDIGVFDALIAGTIAVGAADQAEATIRLRSIDGNYVHLLTRVLPPRHGDAQPEGRAEGLFIDITQRVEAETQLRRFAEVTSHSPLGCVVVEVPDTSDHHSPKIWFGNPPALDVLGVTDKHLANGLPITLLFQTTTADLLGRVMTSVARTGNPMSAERMAFPERPGAYFNIRADRLSDGTVAVTFEDVTVRVRTDERLRYQALHDALTGLPNRVQFDEELQDAVDDSERLGQRIALLLMDLTQFRDVNDAMGHRAGDQLLVEIAGRLQLDVAPHVAMVARLGGDEFAIITGPITSEDEAKEIARQTLSTLERPFEIDGIPVQATANVGIAICPDHGIGAANLLKMADVAMYRAKRTGQGFEVYSTDQDQSSLRRVTLLGELRRAMAAGQLHLHYQPTLDLRTGLVAKVEALVRWTHQHHGLMMPAEFIEMVESSGMIHPLTRWIIVEASRGANQMHDADMELIVSANISVKNLQDPDLVNFFELLTRTDDFHPERLELEITETELMDDPVRAFEVLDRLRTIGLSAAIDDFGVGHSSLAYLKHMPVSHLKIDRGFITTIAIDEGDAAIVRSTIDLAHSLGLKVTAEGVPDQRTLQLLAKFGCDYACGYYLAEPVPMDQLTATVERLNQTIPAQLYDPTPAIVIDGPNLAAPVPVEATPLAEIEPGPTPG